jgi:hypothetical protein
VGTTDGVRTEVTFLGVGAISSLITNRIGSISVESEKCACTIAIIAMMLAMEQKAKVRSTVLKKSFLLIPSSSVSTTGETFTTFGTLPIGIDGCSDGGD